MSSMPGERLARQRKVREDLVTDARATSRQASRAATSEASRAEVCVIACAEAFRGDGEVLASAFGTIPSIGVRLARLAFEPSLVLTDGEAAIVHGTPTLGEPVPTGMREAPMTYRQVFDVVWSGRRHAMMMATQIDRYGNQNISCIGDWSRPKAQLIGVRGAPGNTLNHPTSYWVPSHSPRSFVERVDMVCGVGNDRVRNLRGGAGRFHDLRLVVSNLAVMDFGGPGGSMRLRSVHPGVSVAEVQEATGFELVLPEGAEVPITREPLPEELALIRERIDPRGLRDAEVPPTPSKAARP